MIKIVAKNYVKADKIEEFLVLAESLVADTRKKDAGCIRYELLQDVKDSQSLTMLEEWESKEALDGHMASSHFKSAMASFADLMEKPGEINIYKTVL